MTGLAVVGGSDPGGAEVYPLPLGVMLTRFEAVTWRPARLLGSELVAQAGASGALASALLLQAHALSDQDPGGTLPADDAWLAALAGCSASEWRARRALALLGWTPVRVRDAEGRDAGVRLSHPEVRREAERLYAAMLDRADDVAAATLRQHRARIRGQLRALGAGGKWMQAGPVEDIRLWLRARGLRMEQGHVESAMIDLERGW